MLTMHFSWDPNKARRNVNRHGVTFKDATMVWDDPLHLIQPDRHEDGEERWHALGVSDGVVLLVVWHTYPDPDNETVVRIIGARKAPKREREAYERRH